jgi:hypothetical protein
VSESSYYRQHNPAFDEAGNVSNELLIIGAFAPSLLHAGRARANGTRL